MIEPFSLTLQSFAMLTGRPPFQSTTQEEIYRKAMGREYDWPEIQNSDHYICDQAKNLVEELLQDPEERPSPDQIALHSFFTAGYFPRLSEMSPLFRTVAPQWPAYLSREEYKENRLSIRRNWAKLCKSCGLGEDNSSSKPITSVYKEIE